MLVVLNQAHSISIIIAPHYQPRPWTERTSTSTRGLEGRRRSRSAMCKRGDLLQKAFAARPQPTPPAAAQLRPPTALTLNATANWISYPSPEPPARTGSHRKHIPHPRSLNTSTAVPWLGDARKRREKGIASTASTTSSRRCCLSVSLPLQPATLLWRRPQSSQHREIMLD